MSLAGKRALVTGGAGFIGSNLTRALVEQGAQVCVLDDLSSGRLGHLEAVRGRIDLRVGDVRDVAQVRDAVAGVDVVFHLAAIASVPLSISDAVGTTEVNFNGILNVLEASVHAGVRRVVFASSASVYGDGAAFALAESHALEPRSPYAAAKAAGELMCQAFARSRGIETVCLRYFNIFGPHQDPRSQYAGVIALFVEALRQGAPITIFGDGTQTRDFIFVENVVEANLRAAVLPGVSGRSINIGSGQSVSIGELARLLAELTGLDLDLRHGPERVGDVRFSRADVSLAREVLGFSPRIGLEEGLRRTVAWLHSAGASSPTP